MEFKITPKVTSEVRSYEEIATALEVQRAGIEKDVDSSIEDFIANANKNAVKNVLKSIKAYGGKPEDGYAAWKDFILRGDDIDLRAQVHGKKIPFRKLYGVLNQTLKGVQRQEGKSVHSPLSAASRTLQAAFTPVIAPMIQKNNRGDLNCRQEAVFESFMGFRMMFEGPGAVIDPIAAVLAPHLKQAVREKLLSSYADLKSQAGKPLIDESTVRGLRQQVLTEALARFDRLAAQSYGAEQKAPLFNYNFVSEQMPEGTKFGIEFEGFTASKKKFPRNLISLAAVFKAAGLPASATALPKQDRKFNEWKFTIDPSIVNPLDFNGRYKALSKLTRSSGIEVVSPVLTGPSGQSRLTLATLLLGASKFRTNETCGLHMHVSLEDTTLEQKKNLVRALYRNEDALDQLVEPARRGDKNIFSLSIDKIDLARVNAAQTTEELVEVINPAKDRNYKFDMTGLVLPHAPPTIQYRGAGGAAYLNTTGDYAVILGNFTKQALDNPDVKVKDVIKELVEQRDVLQKARAEAAVKKAPPAASPSPPASRINSPGI